VLAFLRVSAQQALAAFRSHSASSIAGLPDPEQQAYAVRFMREYLSQAWFDKLAGSYNISQQSLSEYSTVVYCDVSFCPVLHCTVLSAAQNMLVVLLYVIGWLCEPPAVEAVHAVGFLVNAIPDLSDCVTMPFFWPASRVAAHLRGPGFDQSNPHAPTRTALVQECYVDLLLMCACLVPGTQDSNVPSMRPSQAGNSTDKKQKVGSKARRAVTAGADIQAAMQTVQSHTHPNGIVLHRSRSSWDDLLGLAVVPHPNSTCF
jgi:hypothetical protein